MMCVFTPTECVVDDDCVEGFECFAIEQCSGSGSMGSCVCENCLCADCPEGEECPPCNCPEEPVCECDDEPVPEFEEECTTLASICFPKEVSCETDADCAEDFTCVDIGMGDSGGTSSDCVCPPCACPPCPEGEECEDCDCQPCECDDADDDFEAEAELICMPNGWEDADYVGGEGDPDTSKAADESEEGAADGSTDDSSGCTASATANGMPAAMMFFLLLGLALVRTRKSYLS
jgi:uncharacterized protein (TIGR03382 family)